MCPPKAGATVASKRFRGLPQPYELERIELLVEVRFAADEGAQLVELAGRRLVLVRHHERPDPLRRVAHEQHARRGERLEVVERLAERLDRGAPLVEPPEDDPDDHSSGSSHGW